SRPGSPPGEVRGERGCLQRHELSAVAKRSARRGALEPAAPRGRAAASVHHHRPGRALADRRRVGLAEGAPRSDLALGRKPLRAAGHSAAAALLVTLLVPFDASAAPATIAAAPCTSSSGPGIAPPARVPSGIPGFHAAWYGQSGYPTLCPGERSTAVVAFYNS